MSNVENMITDIKKPKAILFDWDNTLADTWPTIYQALKNTFEYMGKEPWSLEETKRRVHKSLRDSFPAIFADRWQEAGDKYLENFKKIHLEKLTPLDGAEDVLNELLDTDIYVALVSNKTGSNLRAEISYIRWEKYFSKIVGATDARRDKPHPDPIHMALEGSNIEPGPDVWMIGDSITDLECAYNSNCYPVFYGDQDLTEERFINHQPKLHFYNHDQLLEIIKNFKNPKT